MDVRVLTPGDGAGMFAGGIWDVARAAVALVQGGWVADIMLETHTEGGGGRGVFAIYPDAAGDLDTDVRDRLGPLVARKVAATTGLAIGGLRNGTMGERETGVGRQNFRLGIFGQTEPIKATTTRLIIEYGAHDKEPDLSIAKGAGFADKCGRATAEAFAEFLGYVPQVQAATEQAPTPTTATNADASEAAALKGWAEALIPYVARGVLKREGVVDLREFDGDQYERLALYERFVAHRLAGKNYIMTLEGWDALRAAGKVVLY